MYNRVNLVRRGMAFAGDCQQKVANHITKNPDEANKFLERIARRFQSPSSIILLASTAVFAIIVLCAVEYSIRFVATNLAIVEHTSSSGQIALTDEPDAPFYKAPLLEDFDGEQKLPIPQQAASLPIRPITSNLRSTIRHIHAQEGFRARFRGIRFGIFYMIFMGMFSIIFQAMFGAFLGPIGFWMGTTAAAVMCCNAHATWTHAVIAAPSDKPFFQRFLPVGVAKQLVLPTIRLHAQVGLMHFAVLKTAFWIGGGAIRARHVNVLTLLPVIIAFVLGLGAVLPSYIALIRIEASLLPEEMSAIVPFDRTFGGRMTKLSEASRCRFAVFRNVTLRGAYMTFDRDAYKRTLKMILKFVIVSAAFYFAFVGLFIAEAYVIIGGSHNVRKLIEIARAASRGDL